MAIPHFIHLRARSAYSLLESSLHINQIKDLCIENNMPAICISDSNLFGALEFSETMSSNGIQPLIGVTLNLSFELYPHIKLKSHTVINLLDSNDGNWV